MEKRQLIKNETLSWSAIEYYRLRGSLRQLGFIQNFATLLAILNAIIGIANTVSTATSVALGFAIGGGGFTMITSLIVVSRFEKNGGVFPTDLRLTLSFFGALFAVVVSFISTAVSFLSLLPSSPTAAIL